MTKSIKTKMLIVGLILAGLLMMGVYWMGLNQGTGSTNDYQGAVFAQGQQLTAPAGKAA